MDPITIASIAAAISGAYINHRASQDAQKRQNQEIQRSLENQRRFQTEAEQKALSTAQTFKMDDRVKAQDQIAQEVEKSLIDPVSESQAIRSQQQGTTGDVSSDYDAAKTASDIETVKQAQKLARLLGKTTSAGRLRMDESLRMMDSAQDIDRIANFARGTAGADNIAIEQAGRINPKMAFLGSLLQTAGSAGMMYSGFGGGGVDKLAVGAEPTIAASPGMAPVYDVSKIGTLGSSSAFGPAMYGWNRFSKAFQ